MGILGMISNKQRCGQEAMTLGFTAIVGFLRGMGGHLISCQGDASSFLVIKLSRNSPRSREKTLGLDQLNGSSGLFSTARRGRGRRRAEEIQDYTYRQGVPSW